jgi:WbqC-like protein family
MDSCNRVVILQPGYVPWLGFFDLMARADLFVLLDDVQYTVRDWRSRNRVKTPNGVTWMTVPVVSKAAREKQIREVEIDNGHPWQRNHFRTLETFYRKASYCGEILEIIRPMYERPYKFLIDVDLDFILDVRKYLQVGTEIVRSSDVPSTGAKDEKLLSLCRYFRATHYLSGNAAQGYLSEEKFLREGIRVEWHNYRHPRYTQLWTKQLGFISHLSVLDLLLNHGRESLSILSGNTIISVPSDLQVRSADELSSS